MGFSVPGELSDYLNKDWRRPPQNVVDCSLYYTGLDVFFIDYMNRVVRPCMAYSNGCADNTLNSGVKMNIAVNMSGIFPGWCTALPFGDFRERRRSLAWATAIFIGRA